LQTSDDQGADGFPEIFLVEADEPVDELNQSGERAESEQGGRGASIDCEQSRQRQRDGARAAAYIAKMNEASLGASLAGNSAAGAISPAIEKPLAMRTFAAVTIEARRTAFACEVGAP
jgi:hypothetical protein